MTGHKVHRAVRCRMLVALALSLAALWWSGAGGVPAASAASGGGTLTIAYSGNPNVSPLDPTGPTSGQDAAELYAVFEPLFVSGPSGNLEANLATKYRVTNGGDSIVLTLRRGVTFQDGTPFNASAVVWNLDEQANPKSLGECKTYYPSFKSAQATGPYQVTVNFTTPDPEWLSIMATQPCALIVSPTAYQKEGSNFGNHPVGTGPFVQTSYNQTSSSYRAYDHYWRKGYPKVSQLKFLLVGSDTDALDAVQSGEAQIDLNPTAQDVTNAKSMSGVHVVKTTSSSVYVVGLQAGSPPFNNVLARRALAYATNPGAIVSDFGSGLYTVAYSTIGTASWAYPGRSKVADGYPAYSPTKAKALVKQLGGLSFTLSLPNTPALVAQVEALQAQYSAVGIKMTINPLVENTFITQLHARHFQAWFDEPGGGASPPADPDAVLYRWLYSTSPLNQGNFVDKALDKYITQSLSTFDKQVRKAAFLRVNTEMNKEVPWVYIYNSPTVYVVSSSVQGLSNTLCLSDPGGPCTFGSVSVR